jgi:Uma2 family endonuclease
MTRPASQTSLTLERFLELEREAVQKHEFMDGQMYAMAGAKRQHNLIVTNLVIALGLAAEGSSCQVMSGDMKVLVMDQPKVSYYPDVVVVCDEDDDEDYTTKPCLIVEVLSQSTGRIDQTEKKINYQRLESLEAYLIVHQNQKRIDVHRRISSNEWTVEEYGPDAEIELDCPKMTLKLEDVYKRIQPRLEEETT